MSEYGSFFSSADIVSAVFYNVSTRLPIIVFEMRKP